MGQGGDGRGFRPPGSGGGAGDGYGPYAARGPAGTAGRGFTTTDGVIEWIDDGAVWRPKLGGTVGTQVPAVADWDAIVAGAVPIDAAGGLLFATAGAGGPNAGGAVMSRAPGSTYVMTTWVSGVTGGDFQGGAGLIQRDSGSGDAWFFGCCGDGAFMRVVVRTYSGGVINPVQNAVKTFGNVGLWLRIASTFGVGDSYQLSADGKNWAEILATAGAFQPDQIGIGITVDKNITALFGSWDVAVS